jgi:hypothetical protein
MEPEPTDLDPQYEEAVAEALNQEPRAIELQRMKEALLARRARIEADLPVIEDESERALLQKSLDELDEHIAILTEEANITKFVEDAVRVSLEMRKLQQ